MWGIHGMLRLKPFTRPWVREGYLDRRLRHVSSVAQALWLYRERASSLLCSRARLGSMVGPSATRASVPLGVAGRGATSWDLPVETEGETICCDQPPLLVLPGCSHRAIPKFEPFAFGEGVFMATKANRTDSPTWACAGLKKLRFVSPGASSALT